MFCTEFDPYIEAAKIVCESGQLNMMEYNELKTVFEDVTNPTNNKLLESLYNSVLDRGHIDFDDIPNSKGIVTNYKGYTNMMETLNTITQLANNQNVKQVISYVEIIKTALDNLNKLSDSYAKGFKVRNEYIMLEYNTFVYTCVQATSCIIYEFVDYMKRPDRETMDISIVNTKFKANIFYVQQLQKYNNVVLNMNYKSFLETLISKGADNFIGIDDMVGIATVSAVALAIVPITRALIYKYYSYKAKLSDALAQQAYFLEMNKVSVEANIQLTDAKKKEILKKQEKLEKDLIKLSNKLKVADVRSTDTAKKQLEHDNSLLTIDKIRTGIDNDGLSLL